MAAFLIQKLVKQDTYLKATNHQEKIRRSLPDIVSKQALTAPSICSLIGLMKKIRIAGGQGFWGDLLSAPIDQVRRGPIDYLMLDYLAEVTMSIMQKQRSRNPEAGFARDFVSLIGEILPDILEKNIKVLSNAGGVNVPGCAEAIKKVAQDAGRSGLKIGVVTGDDILERLPQMLADGVEDHKHGHR